MRFKNLAIVGGSLISMVFVLAGLMYYYNQDNCPVGTFPCQNSTICVPQRSWCNGIEDCPQGEDEDEGECFDVGRWIEFLLKERLEPELTCDKLDCPTGCDCDDCRMTCTGITEIPRTLSPNTTKIVLNDSSLCVVPNSTFVNYAELRRLQIAASGITKLTEGVFVNQAKLIWLMISDNKLREIRAGQFAGLSSLEGLLAERNSIDFADFSDFSNSTTFEFINLSHNNLTTDRLKLPYLPALETLFLDDNDLDKLTDLMFAGLPMLRTLGLEGNKISSMDANAFQSVTQLFELNLAYNKIVVVPLDIFQPIRNITKLMIGHNPIENLPVAVFDPLRNLKSLGVEEIDMDNIAKNVFDLFTRLEFVYFKKFHYCTTYAPKVRKCWPASDGVSSLSHLLGKPLLRAAVWGISAVTCLGNALVLWGRFTARDENRVLSIVIRNLAVSDMLMGLYLLIIALEDIRFRDSYTQDASMWMNSWSCTLVGILAMTSSEVSVMILSFMSVERFILIAAPLRRQRHLTPQAAFSSMIVVWVVGIILALIPAIHWRSSTRYYGVNGMCFPLHIDDPFLVGWEYSAFIFLGLNLVGLVTIGYVYVGMFASIWRTRHNTPLSVGDSDFAFRFFLIVLTDAVCWAPIIALKVLAFMKYPVPPDLHSWVVVFILPVNSAINPLLYTFTTPKFRERLSEGWFGRMRNYVTRRHSAQDSQVSCAVPEKNVLAVEEMKQDYPIEKNIPISICKEDGQVTRLRLQIL